MMPQEQQLLRQLIERFNRLERRVTLLDAQEGGGGGAVDSVNGATGVVVLDTDDIAEGATNKYLTQERVEDYVAAQFTGNTGLIDATYNDTTGAITLTLDVSAADKMLYSTAADTWAETTLTSFIRTLLDDTSAALARGTLGLAIGVDVQGYDAELAALAGLTSAADRLPYFTGSGTAALATFTSAARDLLDDANAAAMRTTLGLGGLATLSAVGSSEITDGSVANADLANMAQATIKGRASGAGTGAPGDLTAAQVAAIVQASIDHGSIAGLTDDDHTGYALLAGRSGGQTLIGGTASGDDLTLQSTNHATKGTIFFGANSAFDEVNNRFGAGTTTPAEAIDAYRAAASVRIQAHRGDSGVKCQLIAGASFGVFGTGSNHDLAFFTNSTDKGRFTTDGRLVVGATTATANLESVQTQTTGEALRVYRNLTSTSTDSPLINFIQDHASDDQVLIRAQQDGSGDILNLFDGATEVVTVLDGGSVGLGVDAPVGRFHIYDGNGGFLFVTKTGIVGASQTIIADGTGDVVRGLGGFMILSEGSGTGIVNTFSMLPGDTLDTVIGGNTLRLSLSAGGALTAIRQAGSGTLAIALMFCWM